MGRERLYSLASRRWEQRDQRQAIPWTSSWRCIDKLSVWGRQQEWRKGAHKEVLSTTRLLHHGSTDRRWEQFVKLGLHRCSRSKTRVRRASGRAENKDLVGHEAQTDQQPSHGWSNMDRHGATVHHGDEWWHSAINSELLDQHLPLESSIFIWKTEGCVRGICCSWTPASREWERSRAMYWIPCRDVEDRALKGLRWRKRGYWGLPSAAGRILESKIGWTSSPKLGRMPSVVHKHFNSAIPGTELAIHERKLSRELVLAGQSPWLYSARNMGTLRW